LKTIDTLIEDMQRVLLEGVEEIPSDVIDKFAKDFANLVASRLTKQKEPRKPALSMSSMGSPCERKLWYQIHVPAEELEPLTPDTKFKFLYGDIIEAVTLFLAEVAGHKVEGTQSTVDLHGVLGHRDAVIDGTLVDVKSCSTFSFDKFRNHTLSDDDAFGYIPQLMGYLEAGQSDDLVVDKDRAAFLAIDKTLGHFCLDFYQRPNWDWKQVLEYKREVVNSDTPPDRGFEPVPDGYKNKQGEFVANGNEKLGTFCSYCSAKRVCYPDLRTFVGSGAPKFLTKVTKEPKMFEVKRDASVEDKSSATES